MEKKTQIHQFVVVCRFFFIRSSLYLWEITRSLLEITQNCNVRTDFFSSDFRVYKYRPTTYTRNTSSTAMLFGSLFRHILLIIGPTVSKLHKSNQVRQGRVLWRLNAIFAYFTCIYYNIYVRKKKKDQNADLVSVVKRFSYRLSCSENVPFPKIFARRCPSTEVTLRIVYKLSTTHTHYRCRRRKCTRTMAIFYDSDSLPAEARVYTIRYYFTVAKE